MVGSVDHTRGRRGALVHDRSPRINSCHNSHVIQGQLELDYDNISHGSQATSRGSALSSTGHPLRYFPLVNVGGVRMRLHSLSQSAVGTH